MKTLKFYPITFSIALTLLTQPARAQTDAPPKTSVIDSTRAAGSSPPPPVEGELAPQAAITKTPDFPAATDQDLRLNFRNAPLEMVLNYLSEAAGFVIVLDTEVKGKVDVWSNRPVTKDEAVELLNSMLKKNGYAAIRNANTLTIVKRDEAKTRDIPVKSGSDPKEIPKNDEMVTQIIPVRYANATQMTKDLLPLLPSEATMTANESGNALVITDTQSHIHRMAEIVKALDTSISSISGIHVFPLKYADAKELATAVKDLFVPPTTQQNQNNNNRAQQFFNRFAGGGGPGGPGGGGQGGGNGGAANSNAGAPNGSRVVAIADERTNSLVVSAPEDMMPTIINLVKEIDVNANDITELRVFHLRNADPMEMVDVFSQLFPDDTKTTDSNQQNQGFRFNRGGFGGFGQGANNQAQAAASDRLKKKGKVSAVADPRTSSIIVSAASELMPQIADMVAQLDSNPAKKQRVFVYNLENADVGQVQQVLQDMFDRNNLSGNRSGANQNSALVNRQLNATTSGNSASSSTGFGSAGNGGSQTLR